jgi:hypothetical protein
MLGIPQPCVEILAVLAELRQNGIQPFVQKPRVLYVVTAVFKERGAVKRWRGAC